MIRHSNTAVRPSKRSANTKPSGAASKRQPRIRTLELPVIKPAFRAAAFTLIEIMIVVIIIGILAATIIPQFMGTTYDAKVSAAKGHIAEIEAAIERFNVHMDRYPTVEEGLKVLVEAPAGQEGNWRGPYVKQLRNDPWGQPYQYRVPGVRHATSFDLWSRGADGADGGEGEAVDIGNW